MIKRDAMRPTLARMMLVSLLAVYCAAVGPGASAQPSQSPVIHHDLVVTLDPANHRLKVRDRIRIPGAFVTAPFTISLNADLNVQADIRWAEAAPDWVARAGLRFRHGPRRS